MTRKSEAGNILLVTALCLTVMMGFMGLAVDLGMVRYEKRLQQTAADAAAIAGANDLAYQGSGSVTTSATNAATENGFTGSGSGSCVSTGGVTSGAASGTVCVTVNNGPQYLNALGGSDPHYNDPNYVEVVVSEVRPTYFMGFLKIFTTTVTARAVATDLSGGTSSQNCMYTLGAPASEIGVTGKGTPTLNVTSCGIVDNGNFDPGASETVNACNFGVSGTNTANGNKTGNVNCDGNGFTPSYGMPTQQDPLKNLTAPSPTTPATSYTAPPASCTGYPCAIYNGINIPANSTVTFPPGVYVVTGNDFACGSNSTVNAYGVMFYFTNGATVNCQGGVTMNMGAPCSTSGCTCASGTSQSCYCDTTECPSQYDGILMYQDPNDTNTGIPTKGNKAPCPPPGSGTNTGPELGGNATANFWGVLYFPADQVYMTGTSGATLNVGTSISDSMCTDGTITINMQGTSGMPTPLPTLSNAILVE